MHTPSAAFAWEIWRRHRTRLIAIIGLLLGFALVYPKLCVKAGFNPDTPDALDEFARKFAPMSRSPTLLQIGHLLYLLFLVGGPATAMMLSLLCVTWMFTFIEFNPNAKDPVAFPSRIFTLPISTPFVFWWLLLGGLFAVVVLYKSWVCFVPQPHLDVFGDYQKCFAWMTLLALAQGIVWALAGWPITRLLVVAAVLFCFLGSPGWSHMFESPLVLPTFFVLGAALGRISLQKMRHGQWQGWPWKWPLPAVFARGELRGPKRFSSAAQAQLWFEWRRFARNLCLGAVALAVVPVIIHLVARAVARLGPLQDNTLLMFTLALIGVPVVIHFLYSVSPDRGFQSFVMDRPMAGGEMTIATLKAAAISTAISWIVVFAALGAMPLLGDFHAAERMVSDSPGCRAAIVIGLIFLTWRTVAVNHCFARSGDRWLGKVPILMVLALYVGAVMFSIVSLSDSWPGVYSRLVQFGPSLLACLVAMKLLLAFVGFRISLKRRLLAPSALVGCLGVWVLLVAVLLTLGWVLVRPPREWILPLSLGVVLVVPLARVSFSPIAMAHSRHT